MCFSTEMKDLIPVEEYSKSLQDVQWYLEDLFLAYKYDNKQKFDRDIKELKKVLPEDITNMLERISYNSMTLK